MYVCACSIYVCVYVCLFGYLYRYLPVQVVARSDSHSRSVLVRQGLFLNLELLGSVRWLANKPWGLVVSSPGTCVSLLRALEVENWGATPGYVGAGYLNSGLCGFMTGIFTI